MYTQERQLQVQTLSRESILSEISGVESKYQTAMSQVAGTAEQMSQLAANGELYASIYSMTLSSLIQILTHTQHTQTHMHTHNYMYMYIRILCLECEQVNTMCIILQSNRQLR